MQPCSNDWGGAPAEGGGNHVAVSLSAQIPTRVITDLPRPKISLTISWNFTDWEQNACGAAIKNLWRWQRNWGFDICGFKTVFASDIGAVNQRTGTATIEFDMPDLLPGLHTITIRVVAVAFYTTRRYITCPAGYNEYDEFVWKDNSVSGSALYLQGAPITKFTADKAAGDAPLSVIFTNQTTISDPNDLNMRISSWLWEFGDGSTDQSQNPPVHVYYKPGTYTASLTATNGYGSTKASLTISVYEGPPHPVFSVGCTFPSAVRLGRIINPIIYIDNQGGQGNIDMWVICQSNRIQILQNYPVSGYQNALPIYIPAMTPERWLGYVPAENLTGTWTFFVAPSGRAWTSQKVFEAVIYVEEPAACVLDSDCPEGSICVDGTCIPVAPGKGSSLPLVMGGVALFAGAAYLLTHRG